jgi:uncharacterized NAD(P)/FAD-binding protein YdhS
MSGPKPKPVIGIIGGGFTGAVVALHLAQLVDTANDGHKVDDTKRSDAPPRPVSARSADIVVFEPRTQLGSGLAYDTKQAVHRINVPAERMSAYPADPESFTRWLAETDALADDPDAFSAQGVPFPRREIFGRYVVAQLAPLLASGIIRHEFTTVSDVVRDGDRWIVKGADGRIVRVDVLILAVSHPSPSLPRSLRHVSTHPKLVADATQPEALAAIEPEDDVLVVGNGLTAADVIAVLRGCGHTGKITALSRRGLRSRGHPTSIQEPFGDFLSEPSSRASHLLHRVRLEIGSAAEAGLSWHAVLDALRAQAQSIWKNLSSDERRRIVRHVRPYWDVHRFRIAPQVEQVLDEAISKGSLSIVAASITGAALHEQGGAAAGARTGGACLLDAGRRCGGGHDRPGAWKHPSLSAISRQACYRRPTRQLPNRTWYSQRRIRKSSD